MHYSVPYITVSKGFYPLVHYCVQNKEIGIQPLFGVLCEQERWQKVDLQSFNSFSLGNMNTLSGKSVLSLCRQTTSSFRILANSTPSAFLLGHGLTGSLLGAQRVCHSGVSSKPGSIRTKKRGYDITRNPHLNKVKSSHAKEVQVSLLAWVKPRSKTFSVLIQSYA